MRPCCESWLEAKKIAIRQMKEFEGRTNRQMLVGGMAICGDCGMKLPEVKEDSFDYKKFYDEMCKATEELCKMWSEKPPKKKVELPEEIVLDNSNHPNALNVQIANRLNQIIRYLKKEA